MRFLFSLISFSFFLFFANSSAWAQQAKPYEQGPVHEAYMMPITENPLLQAIAKAPPPRITEQIPEKCIDNGVWLPGYWSWDAKLQDFVWVSGVWRKPPPGHTWVAGEWKQFGQGWVWLKGFWTKMHPNALLYINERPPEPKEEAPSPSPGKDHFWISGYWDYNQQSKNYRWLSGVWQPFAEKWVYVPAHYIWREKGYVFIPAYWDWQLEERGCAYSAVTIEPAYRSVVIYRPSLVLEPAWVIRSIFLYYPDYRIFLWHHWHFHPGFWGGWCCVPPWWGWNTCWCFNWLNSWSLWWWWSHPGFANPPWLLLAMAQHILPPNAMLLGWFQGVAPPFFVFPWGVVSPWALLDALQNMTGSPLPILPADPKILEELGNQLRPDETEEPLLPSGTEEDLNNPLPRPDIGEPPESGEPRVTPPSFPSEPPVTPDSSATVVPPILPPQEVTPPTRYYPPQYIPPRRPPPQYIPPRRPPSQYYPPERRPHHPPQRNPWHRPQAGPRPWQKPPSSRPHGEMDTPHTETYPPNQTRPGWRPHKPSSIQRYGPTQTQSIRRFQQYQRQSGPQRVSPQQPRQSKQIYR